MLGRIEDLIPRAILDDAAILHDHHPIGDLLHRGEVLADEQAVEAIPGLGG